jgi:predicted transcriptional regulator
MIFNYLSGLKEEYGEISVNEVIDAVVKLSEKLLNQRKLEILKMLAEHDGSRTITSAVDEISRGLGCPKSTVWMNVNCLKQLGLVTNGYGKPARVTAVGKIVLTKICGEKA